MFYQTLFHIKGLLILGSLGPKSEFWGRQFKRVQQKPEKTTKGVEGISSSQAIQCLPFLGHFITLFFQKQRGQRPGRQYGCWERAQSLGSRSQSSNCLRHDVATASILAFPSGDSNSLMSFQKDQGDSLFKIPITNVHQTYIKYYSRGKREVHRRAVEGENKIKWYLHEDGMTKHITHAKGLAIKEGQ